MGKMLASSLLLCLSPSHPMPVPVSGLLKTPDQRTLLASAGMISHEASGKAYGHRGGLIKTIAPPPLLSCLHASRQASSSSSHLVAVRKMPGLEQGCGVRLSSLVTISHGRHRFQKGESVSCTTRFL
jgi:hypothetical protein